MSKYEQIKSLNKATFRLLVGIKKETFAVMMEVLEKADSERRRRGGRKGVGCRKVRNRTLRV